jgi:DNA-binding transcriptional regulator of glucitol operon
MSRHRWRLVVQPRWLCWHAFAVLATVGMLWLGDWQLRRAESGNELSWAYTFEWPLFAIFGVYFWARTIRDELRGAAGADNASTPAVAAGVPAAADEDSRERYAARLRAEVRGHGRWHGLR